MHLTKDFTLAEFACHDGSITPVELHGNILELAENLQALRDHIGQPIRVISGYRTPAWNKLKDGAPNSQHLLGKAADIKAMDIKPKDLAAIIEELIREGKMKQGGIGIYRSWVHYDTRGVKARW